MGYPRAKKLMVRHTLEMKVVGFHCVAGGSTGAGVREGGVRHGALPLRELLLPASSAAGPGPLPPP